MGSTDTKSNSNRHHKFSKAREREPCIDTTDTVALLTPHITEVDLWPVAPTTFQIDALVLKEDLKRKNATIFGESLNGQVTESCEDSITLSERALHEIPTEVRSVDRSCFLKEAKSVPALRCLENAMCDMSLMYFPAHTLRDPVLVNLLTQQRASEAQIDEAAALDDELF